MEGPRTKETLRCRMILSKISVSLFGLRSDCSTAEAKAQTSTILRWLVTWLLNGSCSWLWEALAYVMDVSTLDFKRLLKQHQEITKFVWLRWRLSKGLLSIVNPRPELTELLQTTQDGDPDLSVVSDRVVGTHDARSAAKIRCGCSVEMNLWRSCFLCCFFFVVASD